MYPHERSLVKKMADKPFALLGVNSDKDLKELKKTLEEEQITWRSFWNGEQGTGGPISTEWNVRGWPTLFIIDHKGVIRHKYLGNPGNDKLDAAIDKLVAEAEGKPAPEPAAKVEKLDKKP
jgi:AhpC/TSA family